MDFFEADFLAGVQVSSLLELCVPANLFLGALPPVVGYPLLFNCMLFGGFSSDVLLVVVVGNVCVKETCVFDLAGIFCLEIVI